MRERYIRLRDCEMTFDEYSALSVLMARANGLFNGRSLFALEPLRKTSKTCEWDLDLARYLGYGLGPYIPDRPCGRQASIRLIFKYNNKKFSVYLCDRHFKKFLNNTVRIVKKQIHRHESARLPFLEVECPKGAGSLGKLRATDQNGESIHAKPLARRVRCRTSFRDLRVGP
jgi:hypothetical protein